MKKLFNTLINKKGELWAPFFLLFLSSYLAFINWVPGTYLSGWDTLHPEFNFQLAFKRLIFGVFRSDQGLGAVAAHAHMSDLPRVLILYLMSFIFPSNILRYLFIGSNLVIGVLGLYFFARYLLNKLNKQNANIAAFLGSLFYLLNLGTLQHFYVPFEMFTVQYAFLPWLFLTASYHLDKKNKKSLLVFSFITLLSSPMAYASTLWFAYFLCLIGYLILFWRTHFKQVLLLIAATLIVNSFWLFPNLYFLLSGNAKLIPEAKINKIFSEEAFTYNKSYGNFYDAIVFKNFLFDWSIYNGNNYFNYLLDQWIEHLKKFYWFGYIVTIPIAIGIIRVIISRQLAWLGLLLSTLISLVFIINSNPPFEFIFSFLRDNFSIFREALRFPFTKFSIIMMMGFSLFFAYGNFSIINFITKFVPNLYSKKIALTIYTLFIFGILAMYMLPAFRGELISKKMQVNIPSEYFQMFDWFNNQPLDARVAPLPIHSFWGWIYYNWGFQGAQFITFGIKQPVLDRDYDRWNPYNEQYYKEMSYAIYAQDITLVESVLSKYKIRYLVLDQNVIDPNISPDKSPLFINQTKSLFSSSENIKLVQNFNNIFIYEYNSSDLGKNFISNPKNIFQLSQKSKSQDVDWLYLKYGDYLNTDSNKRLRDFPFIYWPFGTLADNQGLINNELIVVKENKIFINSKNIPQNSLINGATYFKNETSVLMDVFTEADNRNLTVILKPKLNNFNNEEISYTIPSLDVREKIWLNIDNYQTLELKSLGQEKRINQGSIYVSTKSFNNLAFYKDTKQLDTNSGIYTQPPYLCSAPDKEQIVSSFNDRESITILAKNAEACVKIPLTDLVPEAELNNFKTLINLSFDVNSSSFGGFCIYDKISSRCISEQKYITNKKISIFLTPTMDDLGRYELTLYADDFKNKLEQVRYSNIKVNKLTPFDILSISPDEIKKIFVNYNLQINKEEYTNIGFLNSPQESIRLDEERFKSNICSNKKPKQFSVSYNKSEGYIEYISEDGSSCDFFTFPNLSHNNGYIVEIKNKNIDGLPLRVCLANAYTKRCDQYLALPVNSSIKSNYILLPPSNDGGYGYNLHIDNYSVGKIPSSNRIYGINIYSFPYNWLTKIVLSSDDQITKNTEVDLVKTKEIVPSLFEVEYRTQNSGIINLDQSYDAGWIMLGNNDHVLVNGWSNGWIIKPGKEEKVYIIYLPQLLEFLGFALIGVGAILLYKYKIH